MMFEYDSIADIHLADLGFWKVYLYIIAEIDARELDLLDGDRPHFNEIIYKIDSAIGMSMGA
jgi:hypothetical protein